MIPDRAGFSLVLSAPSGAGKTTLVRRLLAEFPRLAFSVSHTTRPPRQGEVDGADYHFLDKTTFEQRRDKGLYLEWAKVHDNFYGSPADPFLAATASGRDMLFDVDVQGARLLRIAIPALFVFILPPSLAELERRLGGRGTDAPDVIAKRLRNAKREIADAPRFDALIVNDDLDQAYDRLRALYIAHGLGARLNPGAADALTAES